jgi:hypothetical protein
MRFGLALDLWCKGDPDAPQPPSDLDIALRELSDACAALGLKPNEVAGRFLSEYKKPARQATPNQIRNFIETLHDEAEAA